MAQRRGPRNCIIIGRLAFIALFFLAWNASAETEIVHAEDYDSFWLWAGVEPQAPLLKAREIYVLAGEVSDRGRPHIIAQRSSVPHVVGPDVWIVYRAQTIEWNEAVFANILNHMERWRAAGNHVVGLQIDFDSGTKHLDRYAAFLKVVRTRLPQDFRLSVTGLLDWSVNGDTASLRALSGLVDEVVLQTYQGRRVIPNYSVYVDNLGRMKQPFRVGLLQGVDWHPPSDLAVNPYFRGYVVFLRN
jgi:hypothetical protein